VTFLIPHFTIASTVFIPNKGIPMPITSRAVNVMGRVFTNCPLDERKISTTVRSGFLKHLFLSPLREILGPVYHARIAQQNKGKIDHCHFVARDFLDLVRKKSNVRICSVVSKTACGQLVNSQTVLSSVKCAPHYDDKCGWFGEPLDLISQAQIIELSNVSGRGRFALNPYCECYLLFDHDAIHPYLRAVVVRHITQ
jgi:hypothetical protein